MILDSTKGLTYSVRLDEKYIYITYDQWKEYFNDEIKSWKEFYLIIKNLKLKYRVSSTNEVFSHISKNSNVYFYIN